MQSNQYEHTEDLKYGDNQGHHIIWRCKTWKLMLCEKYILVKSRSIALNIDSHFCFQSLVQNNKLLVRKQKRVTISSSLQIGLNLNIRYWIQALFFF